MVAATLAAAILMGLASVPILPVVLTNTTPGNLVKSCAAPPEVMPPVVAAM